MDKLSRHASSSSQHEKLEAKISQRDTAGDDLALKNAFSLFCVWEESKLVKVRTTVVCGDKPFMLLPTAQQANFAQVGSLMQELATSQTTGHKQVRIVVEGVTAVGESSMVCLPQNNTAGGGMGTGCACHRKAGLRVRH